MSKVNYISEHGKIIDTKECEPNPYPCGYGNKIPTPYIVKFPNENKEYRVYAICYSNCASHYINKNGIKFIPDYMFP